MTKWLFLVAALQPGGAALADETCRPNQQRLTDLLSGNSIYWRSGGEYCPSEIKPGKRF